MERIYSKVIIDHFDVHRQMLFITGARQVGKTTTCMQLRKKYPLFYYFTWDNPTHRELIIRGPNAIAEEIDLVSLKKKKPLVVFDEIHKYSDWKNFLKGFYDSFPNQSHILVTGSARLDVYKKGGDSLMGRYFLYRFHPFSVAEILSAKIRVNEINPVPIKIKKRDFDALWKFGGHPDPFLKNEQRFFNRWKNLRFQQIFQEEIRDLTKIHEISQIEILAKLLKERVGSQTSYESLAKSVRVTGVTIRRWINTLQSLYYCFELKPWSKNITRSLLKEPKYYLWDWSEIEDMGAKAENFIASHLLKAIHYWTDFGLGAFDLFYLRDKDKKEVDFLVIKDNKPWFIVEVKYKKNHGISPYLTYFQKKTGCKHAFQVIIDLPFVKKNCFDEMQPIIVPAKTFLSQLI